MPATKALRGLVLLATCIACTDKVSGPVPITCTPVLIQAIVLNVVDSVTGQPAARGATLTDTVHSGSTSVAEVGSVVGDSTMTTGILPGVYDLILKKPGYLDWVLTGVRVDNLDACHPRTLTLRARVQPLASVLPDGLNGSWNREGEVPGSSERWTLTTKDSVVSGTGSWSGEACCAGPLTVTGYVSRDSVHLDVTLTITAGGARPAIQEHFDGTLTSTTLLAGQASYAGGGSGPVTMRKN